MLVITLGFTIASLRFVPATLAAWAIVVAYEVAAIWIERAPWDVVLSNNFFLVSACLIGMVACYSMERLERRGFLDMRALEHDRQQLATLNQQLHEIALHDHLTGLLSRRYLEERLIEAIANFKRYRTPASLLLIDLDGFKSVNDSFGHDVGDLLLQEVAIRLKERLRRELPTCVSPSAPKRWRLRASRLGRSRGPSCARDGAPPCRRDEALPALPSALLATRVRAEP
jgi:predicted signal transduction protein with EAL and GGDEF domain